jgi:hypothetical protein
MPDTCCQVKKAGVGFVVTAQIACNRYDEWTTNMYKSSKTLCRNGHFFLALRCGS